jgi:hypothetical protein
MFPLPVIAGYIIRHISGDQSGLLENGLVSSLALSHTIYSSWS